ncbi:hypothetical protein AG1IA_01673 [Rhizoctonia solani AG-1 IA]|uniref:Uncharacterized protein n=1 Tax=Thanatephorus cucumeris (strain AG1-IA) TaxID=983506 RepID=L8X5D9_THACA|nr:hypothetical protein AG1IA_01673 [Rhizoctonia solani AG-1 IA]
MQALAYFLSIIHHITSKNRQLSALGTARNFDFARWQTLGASIDALSTALITMCIFIPHVGILSLHRNRHFCAAEQVGYLTPLWHLVQSNNSNSVEGEGGGRGGARRSDDHLVLGQDTILTLPTSISLNPPPPDRPKPSQLQASAPPIIMAVSAAN